jgi:hypothetical protein
MEQAVTATARRTPARQDTVFRLVLGAAYAAAAVFIVWCLLDGGDYYATGLLDRPHHAEHDLLKPSGFRSHGLGIVGSAMLLLLLLYSLRKRSPRMSKLGSPAKWLSVHIFFGTVGPILITLHTTFKVQGLVAVSYWSMVAVALSGIFGRYLYRQIPRNILGTARSTGEVRATMASLEREMQALGLGPEDVASAIRRSGTSFAGSGRLRALAHLVVSGVGLRRRSGRLARSYARKLGIGDTGVESLAKVMHDRFVLERRMAVLDQVKEVFHYWHVVHKPFAYLMLIIMVVHVGVSIALGYTWIF